MRLAHIILAHRDPEHIGRLSKKLSSYSDVYIHIDSSVGEEPFCKSVGDVKNVFFIKKRFRCWWGGYNVIQAELELLKKAMESCAYDRLIFLQGADYPLKSGKEIISFFEIHKDTEFIHCSPCSRSKDPHFYRFCRCYWFYDAPNFLKRVWNKLNHLVPIPLRNGMINDGSNKLEVYWGGAQWAITGKCANYIIDICLANKRLNQWFRYAFPVDELYINTIVMNSPFAQKTLYRNQEFIRQLVDLRNLHYFEYPSVIKVFTEEDYILLQERDELYCRKVNTEESTSLLDMIDALHKQLDNKMPDNLGDVFGKSWCKD